MFAPSTFDLDSSTTPHLLKLPHQTTTSWCLATTSDTLSMPPQAMSENTMLLKPTLHVEVAVKRQPSAPLEVKILRADLKQWFVDRHATVKIGQDVIVDVDHVGVADYTGPPNLLGYYGTESVQIDLQTYVLRSETDTDGRRSIAQETDGGVPQVRVLALPSVALKDEWDSLVFDDLLPSRLLRYMTRMVGRALAQKLSIRLGDAFPKAMLIEINTNAMLSKYFGESGKLIGATFERIYAAAQDQGTLICVVMDEVETIAGSRERSTEGGECGDGLRATNQLLTALDRLRHLSNVIVLCTSNLIGAIDQAFLDRVDIKQLIPSPSPAAIYNIFRSCLNELLRSSLVSTTTVQVTARKTVTRGVSKDPRRTKIQAVSSSPEPWAVISAPEVPTFSEVQIELMDKPQSAGYRVWALAQRCEGFSGRTLRRLPILGLAMYTWGGESVTLDDAISALEAAVNQELTVAKAKGADTDMHDG
ncbi:hypothetical protein LTR56_010855 [Elasticomyces elasticus]|nr:hypothetical protein LTR56_010855 [Elasticomyces elasticus]KAK3650272.1 hypothetical protein LTR22_012599 [Elasticomyces elasticus]KAK4911863.1 hypothetical protein LTR49_019663 [Elasticomyces elasticus]KAK5768291.1 hypothetical protein LTS12_001430 [Elasticomyces elasticus]